MRQAQRRRSAAKAAVGATVVLVSFGGASYLVAAQAQGDGVTVEASAGLPVRLVSTDVESARLEMGAPEAIGVSDPEPTTTTAAPSTTTVPASTSTTAAPARTTVPPAETTTTTTAPPTTTTTVAPVPELELRIGRYGYAKPVHAGATPEAVAAGPAWHPGSAPVGDPGRAVVAVPFNLAGIRPGDRVEVGHQVWRVVRVGRFDPAAAAELFGDPGRPELVLYQSLPVDGGQPFAVALFDGRTS